MFLLKNHLPGNFLTAKVKLCQETEITTPAAIHEELGIVTQTDYYLWFTKHGGYNYKGVFQTKPAYVIKIRKDNDSPAEPIPILGEFGTHTGQF